MTLQVPTILIGLGGIGSTVTHQIYEKLPEERRKKVAMHVFDTDVNTLSKFDHIRKFKTQTSSSKTPSGVYCRRSNNPRVVSDGSDYT